MNCEDNNRQRRISQGSPTPIESSIPLILWIYSSKVYQKRQYIGQYGMVDTLSYSEPMAYTTGTKAGRFYLNVTIPADLEHLYPDKRKGKYRIQFQLSLGTRDKAQAWRNRDTKIKESNQDLADRLQEHDPLVQSAKELYQSLYAKYQANGKLKQRTDWYKAPINYEALDLLTASNDDKGMFSSLVNKLEAEITKFIDIGYGTNRSFDLTELQNSIESIVSDKDTAEFLFHEAQLQIDEESKPHYHKWSQVASVERMLDANPNLIDNAVKQEANLTSKEVELEKQRQKEIALDSAVHASAKIEDVKNKIEEIDSIENIQRHVPEDSAKSRAMLMSFWGKTIGITKDDIKRYYQINNAIRDFRTEVEARSVGRSRSGKRLSDAINAIESQFKNGTSSIKSEKTFGEYMKFYKEFKDFIKYDMDLSDITEDTAKKFLIHLEDNKKLASETIKKYFSGFTKLWQRAKQLGWIEQYPYERKDLELTKRGKEKVSYDQFDYQQLIDLFNSDLPKQERLFFQILACTGFRVEEAGALMWSDIVFDAETRVLHFNLERPNMVLKTAWAKRKVPVPEILKPYLANYLEEAEDKKGRLFNYLIYQDGKCSKHASKIANPYIWKIRKDGQTKLVCHSFRGTFTTKCGEADMNDSGRRYIGGWRQLGDDASYLKYSNLKYTKSIIDKLNLRFIHGDDGLDSDSIMNSETGIDNEFLETFHQNEQQDLLHLLRQKE